METERVAVAVRPRGSLEAVDLGFQLARRNFAALFGAHAAVVLSVSGALALAFPGRLGVVAALVWWLKPVFDRVCLHVLSIALLGTAPRFTETLAALPRALLQSGLLASLTWLRWSPTRSFYAPVLQLEGLRGIARRRRQRVLAGRESSTAIALMGVCGALELVILIAGLQLFATLRPDGSPLEFWTQDLLNPTPGLIALEVALYLVAVCLVEPLYVAGGFTLYINRRVWLEGWDVEIAFRRLERRARAAALAVVLVLLAVAPLRANAAPDVRCKVDSAEDAADCIQGVLEDPEFSQTVKFRAWRPRAFNGDVDLGLLGRLASWLASLASEVARVGMWLLIPVVLAVILVAAARGLRWRGRRAALGEAPFDAEVRRGFDLRPESLPDDVLGAARARFAAGDPAAALSLLYRAALIELGRRFRLRLPASATEAECERLARGVDSPLADDFAALARAWLYCAYGHRPPGEDEWHALCARWSAGFGAAS